MPSTWTQVRHCLPWDRVLLLVKSSVWKDCPTSGAHRKPCVVACDRLNFQDLSLLRGQGMAGSLHPLILPGPFWWPSPSSSCLGSPVSGKQKTFTCAGILEGFMSYTRNRKKQCEHMPLPLNYTLRTQGPQIWQSSEVLWQWEPRFSQRSPEWWSWDGDSWRHILDPGNRMRGYLISLPQAIV